MCAVLLSSSPAFRNGCRSRADRGGSQAAACWPTAGPGAGPCEAHAPGRPQAGSYGRRVGDDDREREHGQRGTHHSAGLRRSAARWQAEVGAQWTDTRPRAAGLGIRSAEGGRAQRGARRPAAAIEPAARPTALRFDPGGSRLSAPSRSQTVAPGAADPQVGGGRWEGKALAPPKPLGAGNRVQEGEARPSPASRPAQG